MVEDLSFAAVLAATSYFALCLLAPLAASAIGVEVGVYVDLAHLDRVGSCC